MQNIRDKIISFENNTLGFSSKTQLMQDLRLADHL